MDWSKVTAKELANMKLSQKRFADGKLIFSALLLEGEVFAYDIRYYYPNEDGCLTPSKSGYRIPIESWSFFLELLNRDLSELREVVCWDAGEHKLFVRYSEEYGGGIDFRLYRESEKYTGWEKKGIRISLKDFKEFKSKVSSVAGIKDVAFFESPVLESSDVGGGHINSDIDSILGV